MIVSTNKSKMVSAGDGSRLSQTPTFCFRRQEDVRRLPVLEVRVTTTEEVVTKISKKEEASPAMGGGVGVNRLTLQLLSFGLFFSLHLSLDSVSISESSQSQKVLAMNDQRVRSFQISPGDLEAAQLDDLIREIEQKSLFYYQEKKKSLRARYIYGTIFLIINLCAWFIRDYAQKALTLLPLVDQKEVIAFILLGYSE
ncbi:hypothetical protein DY000_02035122 [Brassica cretica]|uniref:Uncharacterized protein n=1 Tax=Brassica cretica TaxID=69181 RepID=A0ABQ7DEY1_BRACR|nr:hypothetical protein DY000_02035122 [Brassica cretica]